MKLVEYINEEYQRYMMTDIIFLDSSEAFHRVWHEMLVKKMSQIGYAMAKVQLVNFISKEVPPISK